MNEKDARLERFCRERGAHGVLLRRRSNIAWITDGADTHVDLSSPLGVATVLWTPGQKAVYTDNIEAGRLVDEEFPPQWQVDSGLWWEDQASWVEARLDPSGQGFHRDVFVTDWPEDHVAELRASLTAGEVETVRALGADCAEVMQRAMKDVRPGMSEQEVAARIIGDLRARGIVTTVMLVAADQRLRNYRHPIPTGNRIERMVMAAICAQRKGLIVSITRLVHFGPIDAELRARHEACCRVDRVLHDATRPGARWCDILDRAIECYEEAGYPEEWKKHHQGGPMGYEPRDFKATPTETRAVRENQLVGWNPSITGTKSEDTILSTGEVMTQMSDWPMVDSVNRPDILVR